MGIAKASKSVLNYLSHASGVGQQLSKPGEVANLITQAAPKLVGNVTGDLLHAGIKGMTRETEPGFANLWTGRRESAFGIGVAAAVGAGYMGYSSMKQTVLAPTLGTVSYGVSAPIMDADGVSSTPSAPISNAPSLGANGQMVFGLHNARRG